MARTKKIVEQKDESLLTKQQVWDVLEFSKALISGFYPGIMTPDLLNARMKDISYSPLSATEVTLNQALASPKNSEELLRSFVENFEILSMPFRRILSYMSSHLAFDLSYSCNNAEVKDYTTPRYKRDLNVVYDFLDRFDYKFQFYHVVKQILRNEVYVATVRQDGDKIVLQELPLNFCKITGRWDYGLLASFDFYYFLQPGVDLDLYPPFFKKKYNDLFGSGKKRGYDPTLPPELRGNSQWVYWVDLPPEIGWVFKFDTSLITAIPYFSGLMPDLINQTTMRTLQKDINMASASKMLFGEVPLIKDGKAQVKDMIAIDPKTLGQFLSLVKSSLSSAIKVGSAPLENMTAFSFEGDNELYDSYLRTALASSGMNTALFYTSKLKANVVESQLSFQSDSLIMEQQLYPQFNAFLNYFVNKCISKFKFNFEFEGNSYYIDRVRRLEDSLSLANIGIVLPQKIACALGMRTQDFYHMLEESKAMGFTDMLTPIISAFQQSGKDAGRPAKKEGNLTESGEQTKADGENIKK